MRGRVALVTAGSGGIGAALCRKPAAEGATVAVHDNAHGPAAEHAFRADLRDPGELAKHVPVGRLGTPDEVAHLMLAILRTGDVTNQLFSIDGGMYPG